MITRHEREKSELETQHHALPEMSAQCVYQSKESFGELALLDHRTRGGTILTLSDCHFATVCADVFERLVRKDMNMKKEAKVQFLRQIPYLTSWSLKEATQLFMSCKEHRIDLKGQEILREDTDSNKVIIVVQGEVEIIKRNLSGVYFNS